MAPTYGMDPMVAYMVGRDKDEDNFMNNPFFYLIFIWLFAGFGGGGFGFGGANGAYQGLTNDFLFNNLNNDVARVQDSLTAQSAAINKGLCDIGYSTATQFGDVKYDMAMGQNALASKIGDCCCTTQRSVDSVKYDMAIQNQAMQAQMAECCCATQRAIDSVKYENQAQTTAILQAICDDGRATRDLITSNTIQGLRDELQSAQLALNNSHQTQALQAQLDAIYNKITPAPVPAFVAPFPYGTATL